MTKILLVEDDPMIRDVLSRRVGSAGRGRQGRCRHGDGSECDYRAREQQGLPQSHGLSPVVGGTGVRTDRSAHELQVMFRERP